MILTEHTITSSMLCTIDTFPGTHKETYFRATFKLACLRFRLGICWLSIFFVFINRCSWDQWLCCKWNFANWPLQLILLIVIFEKPGWHLLDQSLSIIESWFYNGRLTSGFWVLAFDLIFYVHVWSCVITIDSRRTDGTFLVFKDTLYC